MDNEIKSAPRLEGKRKQKKKNGNCVMFYMVYKHIVFNNVMRNNNYSKYIFEETFFFIIYIFISHNQFTEVQR
jgi:hypothetical protein